MFPWYVGVKYRIYVVDDKIGVLEPAQQRQIRREADEQPGVHAVFPPGFMLALNSVTDPVVENDRETEDRQLRRSPPGVKTQGQHGKNQLGRPAIGLGEID